MYHTDSLLSSSLRYVQSLKSIFQSKFDSLVANCWVISFPRVSARKKSDKALVKNSETSSYMLLFETAPRACLLWFKDCESKVPTTRICLALSFVGDINWKVTAVTVRNNIFWRVEVLSVIECSNSAFFSSLADVKDRPQGWKSPCDKTTQSQMQTGWERIALAFEWAHMYS